MAKTKAPAKSNTALAVWNEKLAALAKSSKKQESNVGGEGNFISFKGAIMQYRGAAIPNNTMNVIVLDSILENQFYEGAYDASNPASPVCYAFGRDPDTMAPDPEQVEAPISTSCAECPNFEWGSADTGKGKACKEVRRLALITEGDLEDLENAEVAYAKIAVMSVKGWAGYVRQLESVYHLPPMAFVTKMSVVSDPKSQFRVTFDMDSQLEDPEVFAKLFQLREKVEKTINFPYVKIEAAAAPAKPARHAPKKAPAKPAARPATHKPVPAVAAAAAAASGPAKVGLRKAVRPAKY